MRMAIFKSFLNVIPCSKIKNGLNKDLIGGYKSKENVNVRLGHRVRLGGSGKCVFTLFGIRALVSPKFALVGAYCHSLCIY